MDRMMLSLCQEILFLMEKNEQLMQEEQEKRARLAELKLREQRAAALLAQKDALLAELKRKEQLLRAELSQKKALLA